MRSKLVVFFSPLGNHLINHRPPVNLNHLSIRTVNIFLRGLFPWDWIIIASNLTGKALHVGIALWHLAGMKNTGEVKLSGKLQRKMGIQRTTGYNALNALEKAQLVSVKCHRGRNPIVTILKAPHAINNEEN